jgi:hypothetical protein
MDNHGTSQTKKRGGGRPLSIDSAKQAYILSLVKAGNFPEVAAAAAGVPKRTLLDYLSKGGQILERIGPNADLTKLSPNRRAIAEFSRDMGIALAEAEARDVMFIGKHAEKDWRAAAFRLSKRSKDRWGDSLNVSGVIGSVATNEPSAVDWVKAKIAGLMDADQQTK